MNKSLQLAVAVFIGIALAQGTALGRGFGGFHGGGGGDFGGFHEGGFGGDSFGGDRGGDFGGGFHDSSFAGGGFGGYHDYFNNGGYRAGGFDNGGYRGGDFNAGAYHGDNVGGDRLGAAGFNAGGFRAGDFDNLRYGAGPSRGQLNGFLGMPTDAGLRPLGGAIGGRNFGSPVDNAAAGRYGAAGERAAAGSVLKGTEGNVYARGVAGRAGGIVAGRTFTATNMHARGLATQRWYAGRGWFGPGWVNAHPLAWYPARYGAAGWAAAAWSAATWPAIGNWFGWNSAPAYYNVGDVTYQDGNVYYGGQPVGSEDAYYQQASDLASTGSATTSDDADWLPLGVFGIVEGDQTKPAATIQLAVDKQGVVRGNCIDDASEKTLPVQGAVDKKTQRVAWTLGDNQTAVFETGLYDLTRQEAPGLVHFGKDRTEKILLVRLKQDAPQPSSQD